MNKLIILTPLFFALACSNTNARQAQHARLAPAIAADGEALRASALFTATGTRADAGPFLNPRVEWSKTPSTVMPWPANIDPSLLAQDDWKARGAEVVLDGVDLSWFAELKRFDHWDISRATQHQIMHPYAYNDAPIPNFVALKRWARLRLLAGARAGDEPAAQEEVRHLARLCASTETLVGVVIGAHMLHDAGEASDLPKLRRYLDAMVELASVGADSGALAARLADTSAPGYCAATYEALWPAWVLRPSLLRTGRATYAAYDAALARPSPCRWSLLRDAWAARERYLDPLASDARDERRAKVIETCQPFAAAGEHIEGY